MLDNLLEIKKLDSGNMFGSLQLLGNQVEQIWDEAKKFKLSASYKKIDNVVVLGMGGSALGAHLIKSVFAKELNVPIEIVNEYLLPKFVNNKSLVIASSYSGGTEESVFAVQEAKKRKAKIVVISAGGKLAELAKKNRWPALIFGTQNNPCGSPRMGLGYSIAGQLIIFSQVGLLKFKEKEFKNIVSVIAKYDNLFGIKNLAEKNLAKQMAEKTIDHGVIIVGSEHLLGSAHILANQINENAKRYSAYHVLPELNHHLLEGLMNPKNNVENFVFILLESSLYGKRNQKRYEVTKKVLAKQNIKYAVYDCQSKNKLSEAMEVLVFGSYVSYYSAILKNIDSTPIPFVDYFKKEMGK